MVAKLVSPEMFLDLLRDGKPSNVLSEDAASVGGLSSEALKNLWRVYANSELGIARFFLDVPVDKPLQDSFRLQFCRLDLEAFRSGTSGTTATPLSSGSNEQ
jgi:hypothetical protein